MSCRHESISCSHESMSCYMAINGINENLSVILMENICDQEMFRKTWNNCSIIFLGDIRFNCCWLILWLFYINWEAIGSRMIKEIQGTAKMANLWQANWQVQQKSNLWQANWQTKFLTPESCLEWDFGNLGAEKHCYQNLTLRLLPSKAISPIVYL